MLDILKDISLYISGLYILPWILIGFIVTILLTKIIGREKIDKIMNKVGLILLYFFIPVLVFRIFLNTNFGQKQIEFAIVVSMIIFFTYLIAFMFARYKANNWGLKGLRRRLFIITVFTNQGRSSAFIGGALLASPWYIEAAIYIALVGIVLFAFIPCILFYMYKKDLKYTEKIEHVKSLPWFLKLYPWYLLIWILAAVVIHQVTGITTKDFGYDLEIFVIFYSSITIPAALYYVGAGIHPTDFKKSELKKLFGISISNETGDHWAWVRSIFILTIIIIPVLTTLLFAPLFAFGVISSAWFSIIIINSVLPITSTNMFLLPYGIDKKSTAHSITWTTIFCVPIVILLITIFEIYLN